MLSITEIKQTSAERFTLLFSDGREVKTSLGVITDKFLHAGLEITEDEYKEIYAASTLSLAKSRALKIINTRPMSKKEMRDRLIEKGEDPDNAALCADWLCEMGLINDESYAGSVVRHYAAKGYGESRIRQELNRHGIPRELWDSALEEMPEQDEYLERFIRTRLHNSNDRAEVRKLSDALFRRGYSWEQIKHALNYCLLLQKWLKPGQTSRCRQTRLNLRPVG